MNKAKVLQYLQVIEQSVAKVREALVEEEEVPLEALAEEIHEEPQETGPRSASTAVQHYQAVNIINNPNWPMAVPQDVISDLDSEIDQINRAGSILDQSVDVCLKDKHFLDFGCGAGWVPKEALERGVASATGFDIYFNETWEQWDIPNLKFFDDFSDIEDQKFDVVLLYDVLDHCEKPIELLMNVKKVLNEDGIVYIRCHPWSSRHGTHLYRTVNKAYIHLAIDDEIVRKLGHKPVKAKKILRPVQTYRDWFLKTGFQVRRENILTQPLENFFRENEKVRKSIHKHWFGLIRKGDLTEDNLDRILEIEFVDYALQL